MSSPDADLDTASRAEFQTKSECVDTWLLTDDSYPKRWAAEHAAYRVRGVKAVGNEIERHADAPFERRRDGLGEVRVGALGRTGQPHLEKLDVTVSKGLVTLNGEVE